ncbi:MAG: rhodanese-like domain-containing protein [Chitinophagales bacterium]|nr:rhodanese-like domain-containing protein [Chitinophagales bacterium]
MLWSCFLYVVFQIFLSSGLAMAAVQLVCPGREMSISIEDFQQLKNPVILDCRKFEEFKVSHIKNSEWIGEEEPQNSVLINPKDTVIIYCSVGYRSGLATEYLRSKGNQNVFNLKEGIFGYVNKRNSVYTSSGNKVLKVHPYRWPWDFLILNKDITTNYSDDQLE